MYWVNYAWILKNHIFFITCVSPSTLECKLLESWRPAYTVSGHSLTHVEHCLAKVTAQQTLGEWTECALSHWLSAKDSACNAEDAGSIPGLGRSLEEGMAADSSILAWRILWPEEPGGLQFTGSQRVGHTWSNWSCTINWMRWPPKMHSHVTHQVLSVDTLQISGKIPLLKSTGVF